MDHVCAWTDKSIRPEQTEQIMKLSLDRWRTLIHSGVNNTRKWGASKLYYTPGQLRDIVGLSKEAFRHWKRVVPAFSSGRGHAPSFSSGDVLASAVLRRLTDTVGVRIGHLSEVAPAIFEVCNNSTLGELRNKSLVIDLEKRSCVLASDPIISAGELFVVCALTPLIETLEYDLLNSTPAGSTKVGRAVSNNGRVRKVDGR